MSDIEWTDTTWNPVVGCAKVSPGCKNCYAETMAVRQSLMAAAAIGRGDDPGRSAHYQKAVKDGRWSGQFVLVPEALSLPFKWKKPRRVFVNSMSDLFGEGVPDDYVAAVFGVMAATPHITYQVLTKRSARMAEWFRWIARTGGGPPVGMYQAARQYGVPSQSLHALDLGNAPVWPLPNVHLGVSVEAPPYITRLDDLRRCPAAVRWVSCEPLLAPLDLRQYLGNGNLDWVVVGGESGPGARACDISWIDDIRRQCQSADVPMFVKQLGSNPYAGNINLYDWPSEEPTDCKGLVGSCSAWLHLKDRKGGDMAEWPEVLRVREYPGRMQ